MSSFSNRIRIALVITELEVGGAEKCLTQLAVGLDRERFEPSVVVLAPPPTPPRDSLAAQLRSAGVPVKFLGFGSKWSLVRAVHALRRELTETAPHLVQSMLFHANMATRLALPRSLKVPWCAGIRVADPSRLRQMVERRALRRAQRIVCVSQLVADFVQQQMGCGPQRPVVIPNGIDVSVVQSQPAADLQHLGVPQTRRVITCVARLARQKGIDQLLQGAPYLLAELPQHDLLLVGEGPERPELQRVIEQTGLSGRVHLCGWQADVVGILHASDLLVLPSRWEGMPNVVLEAMAVGLPVVATRVEGVMEVLGQLAEPQTVPVGQPQLLAGQIVRLLREPSEATRLGAANRQRVSDCYSLTSMLRQYEMLFLDASATPSSG